MDREQLKLRLRQLELAVDALKAEIYSDVDAYKNSPAFKSITDYDELHDDDDGLPRLVEQKESLECLKECSKKIIFIMKKN